MESKLIHRDLYFKILDLKSNKNYKVEALYDFVRCKVDYVKEQSEYYQSDLKKKLHIFKNEFDKRWQKCNRTKNRFDTIFETWLNKQFILPIQIIMYSGESNEPLKEFIWKNPRTSSTKYCRPIHIQFQKETTELIQNEVSKISNQIQNLVSSIVNLGNDDFVSVKHELVLTMIDGKVCNAMSDNKSAQKCYICGAGPKDKNNLNTIKHRPIDPSTLSFGLSSLHAWIRFFECLIHVAYRLDFKKWQARGDDQEMLKEKKKEIQTKFRQEMGLLIDQPRPGGSGTTNDGNTARRFFSNPDLSSSITGVDKNIIVRFKVMLEVISSGEKIKGNIKQNNFI